MAESVDYDLIVIGGGPAGYAGAIRAAQPGNKVACIDEDRAGRPCLHCVRIPTNAARQLPQPQPPHQPTAPLRITLGQRGFRFSQGL